ncbi:hypothetical protein O181_006537 [Austropuccinia psidii MF-1]|uniref:Uncharacterized protein n=1 Tax=Austropuccinia psidii MF-1 TaxID=1389203 RepID=A0A9Q3BK80_9BASI|nr:hypothetical protein [Austropuccinia psidii MF-1]
MLVRSRGDVKYSFLIELILLVGLIEKIQGRVDLGGGFIGLATGGTSCQSARGIACSELDDDWPDLGMSCPIARHDIPRHTIAMMSATLIQLGRYKSVKEQDFPIDECYTSKPNSTVRDYGFLSQGTFDMWFFAHDKCNCSSKQMPVCRAGASEAQKCNLRTFTLCKITKKEEICQPKHHAGWKPLSQIEEGHQTVKYGVDADLNREMKEEAENSSIDTTTQTITTSFTTNKDLDVKNDEKETRLFQFNPNNHKQKIFQDGPWIYASLWWKLGEILGILGAV